AGTVRVEGYGGLGLDDTDVAWRRARGLSDLPPLAVVSSALDLEPEADVFGAPGPRPILLTHAAAPPRRQQRLAAVADVLVCGEEAVDPVRMLTELEARGMHQVLTEGGPRLFGALAEADVVDELCLSVSPALVAGDATRIARSDHAVMRRMRLRHVLRGREVLFLRYERARSRAAARPATSRPPATSARPCPCPPARPGPPRARRSVARGELGEVGDHGVGAGSRELVDPEARRHPDDEAHAGRPRGGETGQGVLGSQAGGRGDPEPPGAEEEGVGLGLADGRVLGGDEAQPEVGDAEELEGELGPVTERRGHERHRQPLLAPAADRVRGAGYRDGRVGGRVDVRDDALGEGHRVLPAPRAVDEGEGLVAPPAHEPADDVVRDVPSAGAEVRG